MHSLITDNSLDGNIYGCDEHCENYEGNKLKINYIIYSTKACKWKFLKLFLKLRREKEKILNKIAIVPARQSTRRHVHLAISFFFSSFSFKVCN